MHPMQQAFHEQHGLQCGYCTPGMVMTAIKLLEANPQPTEEEIRRGAGGQPLPLHRLPEHRRRGHRGRRGGACLMAITTETSKGIGNAVLRKEDAEFLTGQGRYVDDIKLPGMLHMAIVRSPHAHATHRQHRRIARPAPSTGVVAVLTADDLEFAAGVPCASNPTGQVRQPERPQLAKGKVRHAGEPVAVVVAADRYAARDAADAVVVTYDAAAGGDRRRGGDGRRRAAHPR